MKLLVAYNGSDESKSALDLAKKHAKNFGAEILVMASSEGGDGEKPEEINRIREEFQQIQDAMKKDGIQCETNQLARGLLPGEDVVRFSEENQVDQIYIGIQKKSKTRKLLLGSTAQYVILKANCPVTSVK